MTARRTDLADLPDWPRLLSTPQAAAYCGLSPNTFTRECPLEPLTVGARKLYDRKALDAWIDALSTVGVTDGGSGLENIDWGPPPRRRKKSPAG